MFRDCECKSTVERVEDNAQANNTSLFVETMSDARSPWVNRTGLELPGGTPDWMNPTPPALDTKPSWQNTPPIFSGNGPLGGGDARPGFPQNPTPPIFNGNGPFGGDARPSFPQNSPGNGMPWKPSWGDVAPGGQFNPAPAPVDSGKPWRAGWGDVAPGFPRNPQEPAPDSGKPWKTDWGQLPPNFPRPTEPTPAPSTGNGSPWRAGWGQLPGGFQLPQAPDQADRASSSGDAAWNAGHKTPSPWGGGSSSDLPTAPIQTPSAPAPWAGAPEVTPVSSKGGTKPGDFFPPSSSGGMQKPGDFFPGFPGGSDSTGRPGDSRTGGRPGGDGGFGGSGRGSKDDAIKAFNRDQVTRTEYTFNDAVGAFKALGKENEVSLELQMRDWLNQQNSKNPLTFMRGTAVIADGLGQFRLEEGSRIDLTSHQDTKPRILKEYNYDFGGEATTWLRMAAGSLVEGQQYVRGHKDLVIDGQRMDDAYLQQLKNLQTGVESKLNTVYGAHDVEGVYSVIRDQVRSNAGDWQQGLVRLQRQLDGLRSSDNRFISKSARDVALGYLAEADYMSTQNNGEDAKIMYQSANRYLNLAMQKDGSAPDNTAIANISARLRSQIEKAIDNQWSDPFGNPFNIPKPANNFVV